MTRKKEPLNPQNPPRNGGIGFDYRIEEHFSGDTWFDGKPILRRVFTLTSVGNNTSEVSYFEHGDIDTLVKIAAALKLTNGNFISNAKASAGNVGIQINVASNIIRVSHQGLKTASGVVIIEYTKRSGL